MTITHEPSNELPDKSAVDETQRSSDPRRTAQNPPPQKVRGALAKWTDRLFGRGRGAAAEASKRDPNIYPLF